MMRTADPTPTEVEIDRLRELLSIGAGRAAATLGRISGDTIRMRVPRASALGRASVPGRRPGPGVWVELSGAVGGLAAMLLAPPGRERLVACMLGRVAADVPAAVSESALREAGNILLSSLASAIADTLHDRVLHTPPVYEPTDAIASLDAAVVARGSLAGVRIETELYDSSGALRPRIVWLPDLVAGVGGAVVRPKDTARPAAV